jgi:hypothetical protein
MSIVGDKITKLCEDAINEYAKGEATQDVVPLLAALNSVLALTRPRMTVATSVLHDLYMAYPRHIAPFLARVAISNAIKRGVDPAWLMERVKLFAKMKQGEDPTFIPHPASWFNQERYNDDESEWEPRRRVSISGKHSGVGVKNISDGQWNTGGDARPVATVQDESF